MSKLARFNIGQKFLPYCDRVKREHTIVDILTTQNSAGEVVKIEYITEHEFINQKLKDIFIDTTIARSLNDQYGVDWQDHII